MTPIEYIWSDWYMCYLERKIWVAVMEYQMQHGHHLVTQSQLDDARAVMVSIDIQSMRRREAITRHDLKARLEEFSSLAGHQQIHLGMTSSDLVENTFLIRQRDSVMVLMAAGKTTPDLAHWFHHQQFRGIRGPVGSDADMMDLFNQDVEVVQGLSTYVAEQFGFNYVANAVGQNMPRSYDLRLGRLLFETLDHQVDRAVANGILTMLGEQSYWLEGDVATSCVRRYAWPLLFSVVEGRYRKGYVPCQD